MAVTKVSGSIAAQNTFSAAISAGPGPTNQGIGSLSLSGTFTGTTVWVQRSFDKGVTWLDIESFTSAVEKNFVVGEDQQLRVGVKTGGYAAGPVVYRLSQKV